MAVGEASKALRVRVPRPFTSVITPVLDVPAVTDAPTLADAPAAEPVMWGDILSRPSLPSRGYDRPMRETARVPRVPRPTFKAAPIEAKPKVEENDKYENGSASGDEEI